MEFITQKQQLERVIYSYCESPKRLQIEVKKIGFDYVKTRKACKVKYICREIKNRSNKHIITL